MFYSDVESLGDDSVSDLLVDDDTQSSGVDVEDCSGSAVVIFVWHALVNGTIANDINNITDLVSGEVFSHSDGSVASESFLELVSGSSLISVTMGHGLKYSINLFIKINIPFYYIRFIAMLQLLQFFISKVKKMT